jgi:hypothetical protein
MGRRHPNPRCVKIHRSYSVEEISRLLGVHKNTVRHWLKNGLKSIDDQRPTLVLGPELVRFLTERRAHAKQPTGPGRIYCLPCRAPKVPAGNYVECLASNGTTGSLCGICPDCNRMIYRRVNLKKLDAVVGNLAVSVTQAEARLEETAMPNVNCDSGSKATTHEKPQRSE